MTGGINSQTGRSDAFFNSMTHKGTPLFPTNVQGINGSVSYDELNTWVNENTPSYRKTFKKYISWMWWPGMTMQGGNRSRIASPHNRSLTKNWS